MQKLLRFFWRMKMRYIVFTYFVCVTKRFTARSELFTQCFWCCTALFLLRCCFSRDELTSFCFEYWYDSAKLSVEGHISYTTQSGSSNKSAKRDNYALLFSTIYHMSCFHFFIHIQRVSMVWTISAHKNFSLF